MRSIDSTFYKGKRWINTRDYIISYYGGLCQMCLQDGITTPCKIVHHKIHLNKYNVDDDNIAYGFDNLIPLCQDCHNKIHGKNTSSKRYVVKKDGSIQLI